MRTPCGWAPGNGRHAVAYCSRARPISSSAVVPRSLLLGAEILATGQIDLVARSEEKKGSRFGGDSLAHQAARTRDGYCLLHGLRSTDQMNEDACAHGSPVIHQLFQWQRPWCQAGTIDEVTSTSSTVAINGNWEFRISTSNEPPCYYYSSNMVGHVWFIAASCYRWAIPKRRRLVLASILGNQHQTSLI